MIDSISIADIATYDTEGVKIEGLKEINFIYGANGTGKTTITNILEDTNPANFASCSVKWQHNLPLKTHVYNKNFRERNFGKGKIKGVFTLGEATDKEKKTIETLVKKKGDINSEIIRKKSILEKIIAEKGTLENQFRDSVWGDVYKKYEVVFKEAFTGVMRKEAFRDKFIEQSKINKSELQPYEELKRKAETIFGEMPIELQPINEIEFSGLNEIENDYIWEKKIIGKGDIEISNLIQRLNINDWVNEGRKHLQDDNVCPFCQEQTITNNFRQQLDEYFDEAFEKDINRVKKLSGEYNYATQNLENILQELESFEKINPNTKIDISILTAYIKTISSVFLSNKELLSNKNKEPSRSVDLNHTNSQLADIAELIKQANHKIKEHNKIVENFAQEKTILIKLVWRYLVNEYMTSIDVFIKNTEGKKKGIVSLGQNIEEWRLKLIDLDKKIKEANKNVTSVQPTVDEINRILKSYGFLNFEIVPVPNDKTQYQILREDGTIAESTLSEGEITFITFLYYLQLAKGGLSEDSVLDDRILVIDDPISSLDSNVLFVVSSLIKEILNTTRKNVSNIKQVIILTHNVYFHKEVSYISGKAKENKKTLFWILRKKDKISTIQSFGMNNPIHNSYDLLWRELKNHDKNDGMTIQNIMRRIIENYFKILGKYNYDDLVSSFDNAEEQNICRSMISWINDGSHTLPDDLFIQAQDDMVEKYLSVFERVFINTRHHEHYKMMMGIRDINDDMNITEVLATAKVETEVRSAADIESEVIAVNKTEVYPVSDSPKPNAEQGLFDF
ncbi:MAG: AAA family ATPase [Spirochaetales bacterium]|nr:AAA family ATPase [Spirochaetales bacterium]